ncbi:uncharacterized protein LOC143238898 isoform X2 [Tachypleus tridentatus]|uniref:uncharacterized protein LOC143238898 isoform X2 n=1 Tax=Tachypleus tridentatus TaxID=6853 RepID=UPI003FD60E49
MFTQCMKLTYINFFCSTDFFLLPRTIKSSSILIQTLVSSLVHDLLQLRLQNLLFAKACKCNGRSSTCYFDWDLYKETGQGGRCKNCQGDTEGPYCERCKDNFFMKDGQCTPCLCDFKGSIHTRCKENGQCFCKPGVEGLRCDTCEDESYELVSDGCRRRHGTVQTENDINALSCFCYGHSSVCQRAFGYVKHVIISTFKKGTEEWTALTSNGDTVPLLYDPTRQSVHVSSLMSLSTTVYFVASDKYLGDQRSSYNQALSFTLKIGEPRFTISEHDVVIEGENMKVSISITQQNNNLPMTSETKFKFTLSELPVFGWKPQLDTYKFLTLLSNLTALKIRANLSPEGETFLYDVKLESARPSTNGETANWVENCTCPRGYVGQFCEACDQGYTRNIPVDSRFAKCIPCKYGDVSYLYDRETECPPCFKMVQHVVRDLKFRLDEIIQLLSDKQGNRQNVVDLISNKTLSNISQNIIDLLDKAQHLTGQEFIILKDLKDLKAKLFNSTKLSTQIKLKVQKTKSFSDLGKERIFMVMEQIENVSIILLNMKNLLSNITRDYFKNSSNVIKIFQQQSNRMKEIANEADRLADNQKIEEEETRDIAVKALNVSTLAYSGIQNLVQAQSEGSLIEVKELQKLIFGMKQMLSRAMNEVCSAAEDANRIYDEVLEFLNHGTSIIVPEFNEQATMYRDFHIINEAIGSIEKTDNILEENPHLDDEIKEKKSKANNILNEAILLQKGKEKLMTDTEAALDKARENVQSG